MGERDNLKILIVSQYFWPETFLVNSLAEKLVQKGHQVTVLTGLPNYPGGQIFNNYSFIKGPWRENYKGADVVRIPLISRGKGFVRLAFNYLSFVISATFLGFFKIKKDFDMVFCFATSPITSCLPAIAIAKYAKKPLSLWVLDLWPESVSAVGAIKNNWILNAIGLVVRFIYKCTDIILIQSEAFRPSVIRWGGQTEKIHYLPNWSKIPNEVQYRPQWLEQLPQGFKIVFAGNVGHAQDMPTLIKAAEILKSKDIKWIVVGDGSAKSYLDEEIQSRGLQNSIFTYGRRPNEDMSALYDSCDVALVLLKDEDIFALTVPAKVQSYMASKKPILASLNGEGHRLVNLSGAGLAAPSENPAKLAEMALKMFLMSKSDRESMGLKGFDYFKNHFEEDRTIEQLVGLMQKTLKNT